MRPLRFILVSLLLCLFSAGCASKVLKPETAPQTPGQHKLSIIVDKIERSFVLYLPPQYDSNTPLPLLLMLHGGGGSAESAIKQTGWDRKADAAGFIAVFPNALARNPGRRSSFALNPQLWNDGSGRFYPDQHPVDDIRFIASILDIVEQSYSVDQRRIYLTGFSNGASMSFLLATKLADRITAIAPVAGACWIEPGTLRPPVSMLYMTGTDDPLNAIDGGPPRLANGQSDAVRAKPKPAVMESIMKWVSALGLNPKPVSSKQENAVITQIYTASESGDEVQYVAIEGLGHTWAGGRSLLPESWVGASTDRINATDVIWNFFQRHSR